MEGNGENEKETGSGGNSHLFRRGMGRERAQDGGGRRPTCLGRREGVGRAYLLRAQGNQLSGQITKTMSPSAGKKT